MHMHQALTRSKKIRTFLPRHEQGGVFAAEGYARATGRPMRVADACPPPRRGPSGAGERQLHRISATGPPRWPFSLSWRCEVAGKPKFDYALHYANLDLRAQPELYRVGVGEQGVLLVQPYKGEILPHWRFKDAAAALESSKTIYGLFEQYFT